MRRRGARVISWEGIARTREQLAGAGVEDDSRTASLAKPQHLGLERFGDADLQRRIDRHTQIVRLIENRRGGCVTRAKSRAEEWNQIAIVAANEARCPPCTPIDDLDDARMIVVA